MFSTQLFGFGTLMECLINLLPNENFYDLKVGALFFNAGCNEIFF